MNEIDNKITEKDSKTIARNGQITYANEATAANLNKVVNLEWRLEVRLASRSLLNQTSVCVTMKLCLSTVPKHGYGDAIEDTLETQKYADEQRDRKDLLVQTDLNSLVHIIQTLEDALIESRTRRIRNIVGAIH